MREYWTPPTVDVPRNGNLTDDLLVNARIDPHAVVCSRRAGDRWVDVTAARFLDEVRATAKGLMACGIAPGDRVALLSRTRYEWTLLDYAIWFAGAVSVPVYASSPIDQVTAVVSDSRATALVVETPEHAAQVEAVRQELGALQHVWCLEERALARITTAGAGVSDEAVDERRTSVTRDSLATLIYTSGTTGRPKGCMLTHGNFLAGVGAAVGQLQELFQRDQASTLLFLPLAHVFARTIAVGAIRARVRLGHCSDVTRLFDDLETFRPTFMLGVPRVFENLFNTSSQRAAADGRGRTFDRAAETAIDYSRALDTGRPGPVLRARHAVFDRLVYRRLRATLGGRCEHAVSGGAPLGERLGHFYRGIGLNILEGYGLTETTGAVTANLPQMSKMGTVGRPLPGAAIRIGDAGELLVRGPQVFSGYWGDLDATRRAVSPEGWLHTGDLGEIDEEGFIRVTGRQDEILVTTGGKHVAPTALEDLVRSHPLVAQCLVVGDAQPFVAALVTLDAEAGRQWAGRRTTAGDLTSLAANPVLLEEIERAIDDANRAVSQAASIRKFKVLPVSWTEEGGQLTASLKLRREVVLREFRHEISALYAR